MSSPLLGTIGSGGGSRPEDVSATLARHCATLTYEQVPSNMIELAKQIILDTVGVIIGATALSVEGDRIGAFVARQRGGAESVLLGQGLRVPTMWAAFGNGSLGHVLDFDDVGPSGHSGIGVVPTSLAVAEREHVSGKDLLVAVVVGMDVQARLGLAIPDREWPTSQGWFATQLLGYFAAAASAARLLQLSPEATDSAFGIALTQAAGCRQMAFGASHLRGLQAGFSSQGGLIAADLAAAGIAGPPESLEGTSGLYASYFTNITPSFDVITDGLGMDFPILDHHSFKIWPCCGKIRPVVAALLDIQNREGIPVDAIERVEVIGGRSVLADLCEPYGAKRRPQFAIDAKFSLPFTAAVALRDREVTMSSYSDGSMADPDLLGLADRISYVPEKTGGDEVPSLFPEVRVTTYSGREFRCRAATLDGRRGEASWEELIAKYSDCVRYAASPMSRGQSGEFVDGIRHLEQVEDITELCSLFVSEATA